jgi:5-methyltetrahydropteroyltriglutamate--homocysteine methyltransferase
MAITDHRFATTHAGSLPRPPALIELLRARETGEALDEARLERALDEAVTGIVARQCEIGIDIISDGEQSKIDYATYVKDRLTGFEGAGPLRRPADLVAFPGYTEHLKKTRGLPGARRPDCVGPVKWRNRAPLDRDIARFKTVLDERASGRPRAAFLNAASPGVIAVFLANRHYPSHEAYIGALSDAMKLEYDAIHQAGFQLQIDCPDLAMGRHMLFPELSDDEFRTIAALHVEALNAALADIPPEDMRLHICWGNYEGPHTCDIELEKIIDIVLDARPAYLLFEGANPRHCHEWEVFETRKLPQEKILVPGVIDTTSNFVEHPDLVAQRLAVYAKLVGPDRVIAGTDCGFSTFADIPAIHPDITWAKLETLVEGARRAAARLI